jgi:predicted Co/Zn/Cd cation transporter (cation efflux family)
MDNSIEERELTPEELLQRKEEMYTFYTESLKYLQAQLDYEETLAKIDEARFKRLTIQMQHAMMMNPPEDMDQNQDEVKEAFKEELTKERKLKKN